MLALWIHHGWYHNPPCTPSSQAERLQVDGEPLSLLSFSLSGWRRLTALGVTRDPRILSGGSELRQTRAHTHSFHGSEKTPVKDRAILAWAPPCLRLLPFEGVTVTYHWAQTRLPKLTCYFYSLLHSLRLSRQYKMCLSCSLAPNKAGVCVAGPLFGPSVEHF